jgi:hypothetical protein
MMPQESTKYIHTTKKPLITQRLLYLLELRRSRIAAKPLRPKDIAPQALRPKDIAPQALRPKDIAPHALN